MGRTALFSRHQPGGVFTVDDLGEHPGEIFFVGSTVTGATDGAGYGKNPDAPVATLDYAIGLCTANKGDVIYVLPGHAETLTAAGGVTCDIAGVKIIGLGAGADRPTFTFGTATTASILISAASVTIKNIVAVCNIDAAVNPFHVQAADCTLDVEFRDTSDTVEAARAVLTTAAADRLAINMVYRGRTGGDACVNAIRLVGCDGGRIVIDFYGKASTAVVEFLTTACTNIKVLGRFHNSGTSDLSKNVVDTATGSLWSVEGFDTVSGQAFSGGDAAAVAGDDVSTIIAALYGTAGIATWPAAAAAANNVSIAEVLRYIEDALMGTAGVVTYPAAAAPANGVSIAEVLRDAWDVLRNGTGGAEPATNRSVMDYLGVTPAFFVPGLGYAVTKTEDLSAANDDLFTVTGKVALTLLTGEVTNALAAAVTDYALRVKTTAEAICAATNLASDAIGTMYMFSGHPDGILNGRLAPTPRVASLSGNDDGGTNDYVQSHAPLIVGLAGGSLTIESSHTAGDAGDAIVWTLFYVPLEAGASVAAAA